MPQPLSSLLHCCHPLPWFQWYFSQVSVSATTARMSDLFQCLYEVFGVFSEKRTSGHLQKPELDSQNQRGEARKLLGGDGNLTAEERQALWVAPLGASGDDASGTLHTDDASAKPDVPSAAVSQYDEVRRCTFCLCKPSSSYFLFNFFFMIFLFFSSTKIKCLLNKKNGTLLWCFG